MLIRTRKGTRAIDESDFTILHKVVKTCLTDKVKHLKKDLQKMRSEPN